MFSKITARHYFLLLAITTLFAVASGSILKQFVYTSKDHERVQKVLNRKYKLLDHIVNQLKTDSALPDNNLYEKNGIIILLYRFDSLLFWSNNNISMQAMESLADDTSRFAFISNAWYIIKHYTWNDTAVVGLLKIKNEFPYQNRYLTNSFSSFLRVPETSQILLYPSDESANLNDWQGRYLFSLDFDKALKFPWLTRYLPPICWFISLMLLLLLITILSSRITSGLYKNFALFIMAVAFFIARVLQVKYLFPGTIYNLELFGPFLFARSLFMPSLGDVMLNSILILFLIIRFRSDFDYGSTFLKFRSPMFYLFLILLIALLTGYFFFSHYIFSSLILNSSINFETFKVTGITVYTFVGLLIFAIHFTGLLMLTDYIIRLAALKYRAEGFILIFSVIYALSALILYFTGYSFDLISFAGFYLFFIFLVYIGFRKPVTYSYSALLIFVLLFSVFSVYFIARYTKLKEKINMKVLAENLASEHDPVAEYLLEKISNKLIHDQKLADHLFDMNISTEEIFKYLQENYFNGFWGKYSLRFTDCKPQYKIYTDPAGTEINCYKFFNELIQEKGLQLPNSNFYFIDTLNGRINYLGKIKYTDPDDRHNEITLFIELESRLIAEELGYPKLLIEEKYGKSTLLQDYSYAKYYKNRLIAQSGSFPFSLTLDYYKTRNIPEQGYDFLIYEIDNDNVIIISKPAATFFSSMVSFSYIFVFYYFLVLLYLLVKFISSSDKGIEFNFKNKIQFSILSVLLLSLILIGSGTIYFSIKQYKNKQHDILSEKIQSVYIEIDHKLAYVTKLSANWNEEGYSNLNQLLTKFSDVFYTDINLYDPQGNLLATSRPEVFERGLLGEKMNPLAFYKITVEKQAEFVNHEKIGSLSYLSAYVPYLNVENKLLAILNLPYFTKQDVLSKDISNLIVAIINVYVLLILMTLAIAVFISEQITKPLRLIQQKFSEIKLGRQYEEIHYHGKDEIGNLVAEYNRMVRELEKSVEMLARSERESAWREMAKQIAHEIKNPLTPMKLSVQQLQRAWKDNKADFDKYLERVSRTLVEQIEDLSNIASEFSNFAKMPRAVNEKINLAERIRSTLDLFSDTENIEFTFKCTSEDIYIMADKEQISRVFINLIKNAIQAIPENKKGKINLTLDTRNNNALFTISDNGKGIPEELRNKMFTPNFTTKSSGMGLGLAIVKNIIETCEGSITFDTDIRHGTTFYIEIPLYRQS